MNLKLAIRLFSVFLLIVGISISAILFLAFTDMRSVGATALGDPEVTYDSEGNLVLIVRIRIYNNGSYLTLENSSLEMKIIDDEGNVIDRNIQFFNLAPKSYIDFTIKLHIPVDYVQKARDGEIELFVSTKLVANPSYHGFVLLSYSLESISPLKVS